MSRHSDVCGQRVSGVDPLVMARGDCPRTVSTGTSWLIASTAVLATVGAAAVAIWVAVVPSGLGASGSDALLSKLAALAQDGPHVLCDPAQLEKRLPIRIGTSATQADSSAFVSIVSSGNAPGFDTTGIYSKSKVMTITVCRLRLRFPSHPFCATDSAHVQRMLGARVQFNVGALGESDRFNHGYVFIQQHQHRSIIGWREPPRLCLADVEIIAEQA